MLIELTCPKCGAKFRLNNEVAGPEWTCGGCGMHFSIPQYTAPAETPPTVATAPHPLVDPVEIMRWEGFRVATRIASWGAVLGIAGTLIHGAMMLLNAMGTESLSVRTMQVFLTMSLAAGVLIMLEFAFAIVAACVCRSSDPTSDARTWSNASLAALSLPIVLVCTFPFFPNLILDPLQANAGSVFRGMIIAGYLGYLGGHAAIAMAFTCAADRIGQSRESGSLTTYLFVLAAIAVWATLEIFVFSQPTEVEAAAPIDESLFGGTSWIHQLIYVAGTITHLCLYRSISRQADARVRSYQLTLA